MHESKPVPQPGWGAWRRQPVYHAGMRLSPDSANTHDLEKARKRTNRDQEDNDNDVESVQR